MDMILSCSTQCFTYILVNYIFLQNPRFVRLSGYGMHNRGRQGPRPNLLSGQFCFLCCRYGTVSSGVKLPVCAIDHLFSTQSEEDAWTLVVTVPQLRHIGAGLLLRRPLWPGLFLVGFVVGALALGQVFSPRTSVFRCHVNSSNAPASCHLYSHSYQQDVRAKPADPTKKSDARLKIGERHERKYFFLFMQLYCQIYPLSWLFLSPGQLCVLRSP